MNGLMGREPSDNWRPEKKKTEAVKITSGLIKLMAILGEIMGRLSKSPSSTMAAMLCHQPWMQRACSNLVLISLSFSINVATDLETYTQRGN